MPWNEMIKTFKAGEALLARRRVKIESGTVTDPPEVVYADAGEVSIGVTEYAVADEAMVAVKLFNGAGTFEIESVIDSAIARGTVLYGGDSGIVTDTSSGSAVGIALQAPGVDNEHIECAIWAVASTTAATVSIADTGAFTAAATVEAALAEIYQGLISAQGIIDIPIPYFSAAGVALAAFSDGASDVPGFCVTAEGMGVRWNNHAAPLPVASKIVVPPQADVTANMVLNILAAKTGATIGDAVTFDVEAFNNDVGALYDADADFGGTTSAMTGDATAKTIAHLTLTLALANLTAYPAAVELTIKPTAGTLGTDDVIMLAAWVTYTSKILTS